MSDTLTTRSNDFAQTFNTAGVYLGTLIGDYEARKNGLTS